jgi:hypothetical protein
MGRRYSSHNRILGRTFSPQRNGTPPLLSYADFRLTSSLKSSPTKRNGMALLVVLPIGPIDKDEILRIEDGTLLMHWTSLSLISKLMRTSPPTACSLNYNRDCPPKEGCVISAIKNQTKILEDCHKTNVISLSCTEALKYVVHFFGDITQPLHCSNKSLGGNQIFVKFDGLRKNLHEVRSSHPRC